MKWIAGIGLLGVLVVCCSKKEALQPIIRTSVIGKWKLIKYYINTGGGNEYHDANHSNPQYVEFKTDGVLEYSDNTGRDTTKFETLESEQMKVVDTASSGNQFIYWYQLNRDTLKLYPPCIEGCGYIYKAVE